MEVKPGYKQTDVGVIPEDWRVTSVEDIATVGRGRVISHRDIARARNPQYPIYSSQTSNDGVMGYIDTFDFEGEYITWTTDGANAGTVFARNGRFNCTNVCGTIKLTSDSHFFIARVLSGFAPRHVSRHLGNPKLMNDIMKRVKIPLPSTRQEQDAIATALGDVDALLVGLDRLIAKKRDLKQAAMQQLLTGQTRLPGFSGAWPISTVGCEFEIQLGKMLDAARNTGSPKPYVGNKAVQWGRVELSDVQTVPLSRADLERYRLAAGDLLVCEGGEVGRAAIWEAPISECYFQKALHRLRPTNGFNIRFMLGLLRHWVDRGLLGNYVTQTSIAHLTREKFAQVPLPVPTRAEQDAIAAVLSEMEGEISALTARRAKTRALKQAMMQELLTGKTRLVLNGGAHA